MPQAGGVDVAQRVYIPSWEGFTSVESPGPHHVKVYLGYRRSTIKLFVSAFVDAILKLALVELLSFPRVSHAEYGISFQDIVHAAQLGTPLAVRGHLRQWQTEWVSPHQEALISSQYDLEHVSCAARSVEPGRNLDQP